MKPAAVEAWGSEASAMPIPLSVSEREETFAARSESEPVSLPAERITMPPEATAQRERESIVALTLAEGLEATIQADGDRPFSDDNMHGEERVVNDARFLEPSHQHITPVETRAATPSLPTDFSDLPHHSGALEHFRNWFSVVAEVATLRESARTLACPATPLKTTSENSVEMLLLSVWGAGGAFVFILSLYRVVVFRLDLSRDRAEVSEFSRELWLQEWDSVCKELKIRRRPIIGFSKTIGPGLCPGILRSRLVIPVVLWQSLDTAQRETVLRHEAAHLVRRDLWRSFLIRLLALPHWFNPCAWLAVRRFDEAAEWACDEFALLRDQQTRFDFAALLVELATGSQPRPVVLGQQLVRRNSLNERVQRLVREQPDSKDSRFKRLAFLAIPFSLVAASIVEVNLVAQPTPATATVKVGDPAIESPRTAEVLKVSGTRESLILGLCQRIKAASEEEVSSHGRSSSPVHGRV